MPGRQAKGTLDPDDQPGLRTCHGEDIGPMSGALGGRAAAGGTSGHVTGIHPAFPVFLLHSGIPEYPKPCRLPAPEDC